MNKPQTHFTPGPWNFTLVSSKITGCKEVTYIMVEAKDDIRLVESCDRPLLEKAANGALIAAAPEMFSVLVEVAEFLEELATSTEDFPLSLSIARGKVEQIIEKANYKD